MFKRPTLLRLGVLFLLVGCGQPAAVTPALPEAVSTHEATLTETLPPEPTGGPPAWFSVDFVDARSNEKFSISGFSGKVILVETMAVWCRNCQAQQEQIQALLARLGARDDLVAISLDADPNENLPYLKAYVKVYGFDWLYSITGPDVARELGQLYGDQFLSPSSTPVLIVDRQGGTHLLPWGIKNADELEEYLKPYLG